MELSQVVPFGRGLDEYRAMFQLTDVDMRRKILGVGDGPASFNAEMTALGQRVVSVDPLYDFTGAEIRERFCLVVDDIMEQVQATPQDWVWTFHRSPAELRKRREWVIEQFRVDLQPGKESGRYLTGALPTLPFADQQFELALCSHFLFLYSAMYDFSFHLQSVLEMARVAHEARIFPLLTLRHERSPYLNPLRAELAVRGFATSIVPVNYELQRGGNKMLRVLHRGPRL